MNCPYCGVKMESGFVQSNREFYWTDKLRPFFSADMWAGSLGLSTSRAFKGWSAEAWLCRGCRKVIIDYGEK